jgi:hypothetical protein
MLITRHYSPNYDGTNMPIFFGKRKNIIIARGFFRAYGSTYNSHFPDGRQNFAKKKLKFAI